MTVKELRYFRVTCDAEDCKTYINVAAANDYGELDRVLSVQTIRGPDGKQRSWTKTRCPEHAET